MEVLLIVHDFVVGVFHPQSSLQQSLINLNRLHTPRVLGSVPSRQPDKKFNNVQTHFFFAEYFEVSEVGLCWTETQDITEHFVVSSESLCALQDLDIKIL